jgi:hypothetical protein
MRRACLIGFCLLACAATMRAQLRTVSSAVFTAPDREFAFRHSNQLIRCEQCEQPAGGPPSWYPSESCGAYWPVCDGDLGREASYVNDKYRTLNGPRAARATRAM